MINLIIELCSLQKTGSEFVQNQKGTTRFQELALDLELPYTFVSCFFTRSEMQSNATKQTIQKLNYKLNKQAIIVCIKEEQFNNSMYLSQFKQLKKPAFKD